MKSILLSAIFILPILSASKSPCPYSKYQIESWVLGGGEGFRDIWYEDGKTPSGVKKYSIGHGYNDWGTKKRRDKIQKYLDNGLTWEESMEISRGELNSVISGHSDYYTDIACRLHVYNTGKLSSTTCQSIMIRDLGRCCGASAGCGSPYENVRNSHNLRRKLEVALATHNFGVANEIIELYRDRKDKEYRRYQKTKNHNPNENINKPRDQAVPAGWFDRIFGE